MTALLGLLAGLVGNSLVKSALISVGGSAFSLFTQWYFDLDLGKEGTAATTGAGAFLANLINKFAPIALAWLQAKLKGTKTPELDLSSLQGLGPLTDEQIERLEANGYRMERLPAAMPYNVLTPEQVAERQSAVAQPAYTYLTAREEYDRFHAISGEAKGDGNSIDNETWDKLQAARENGEVPFGLLIAFALFLTGSSAAWAEAPRAIVNGPTTAVPGELIVLDASGSENAPTHFTWRISPEIKGRKQIAPVDGGKRLQMASFAGRYLVTLLVSNADGNDVLTWQVDVPGNPPCPSPDPQPVPPTPVPAPEPVQPVPPAPSPVIPTPVPTPPAPVPAPVNPGRFGIGQRVRQAVMSVQSPSRAAEVAQLRSTLETLHQQGTAGSITAQEFLDVMSKALKALPDSWQVVKTLYSLGIKAFVAAQTLSTVADFTDLAAEILDAIKGL